MGCQDLPVDCQNLPVSCQDLPGIGRQFYLVYQYWMSSPSMNKNEGVPSPPAIAVLKNASNTSVLIWDTPSYNKPQRRKIEV